MGELTVCGVYIRGLGRASRFIASEPYNGLFRSILGAEPFPGTLNIKLKGLGSFRDLATVCRPYASYGDFVYQGRVFGGLTLWIGYRLDTRFIVLRPHRSSHSDDVLEIVGSIDLKKRFDLEYGDEFCFRVICGTGSSVA